LIFDRHDISPYLVKVSVNLSLSVFHQNIPYWFGDFSGTG